MNRQSFDLGKQNWRKHLDGLLTLLLDYNSDMDNDYAYDVRIHQGGLPDEVVVEWAETPKCQSFGDGGSFKWVDVGDEVYTEVRFPDDHYEMVPKGTERDALKEWLKEHPGWEMNECGMWTNAEENRQLTIDHNVPRWLATKESPNDSTFKEYEWHGPIMCHDDVIGYVGGDVLHRTGYIVAGNDFLEFRDEPTPTLCLKTKYAAKKYGECTPAGMAKFDYEYKDWRKEPTTEEASIPVYIDARCDGSILYLTNSDYLIARLTKSPEPLMDMSDEGV